uniref:Amino acid transporter transmembrane domain-containing protein n=1 Tax=Salix viminalis TaxID=40686 RepID=A0A6N2LBP7_SALVM
MALNSTGRIDEEERRELAAVAAGRQDSRDVDEGKGTWKHAAFHVATTIATPAAYAPLPFALASLGWRLGVSSLVGATLATWYSSLLIASLWRWNGKKQITYRHLAESIFGFWGYWSIAFFQQVASLGNNIAIQIAAGSSLKAVYKHYHKEGTLTLQHFIIFFGAFELFLSQLPDIHSLRWVNALCTFSTIGFAGTAIGVTLYNGENMDRKSVSYSVQGSSSFKRFKAFNALGVIAFSFGDAMLPEIQSTVKEPAKRNMYKGVSAAYTVIILTYWQLAFCGYWAFGSEVQPYILASLTFPEWTIVMANLFAVIQISGCYQIYCRPTYAYFEKNMLRSNTASHFPLKNHLIRLVCTSIYIVLITLIAAAMPFFGDFVSICGAIGFTPLDFVFPAIAYLKSGRMPKNTELRISVQILNLAIATWFSVVAVLGCIGAVRFIVEDIKTYKFFHDMAHVCRYLTEEAKLDVNVRDWKGETPLHYSISTDRYQTAVHLLENGADPNAATDEGLTPLHYAAKSGLKKLLLLLIMKGAKVDAKANSGTPLQWAASHGQKKAVEILLDKHADPNMVFDFVHSPLMASILASSFECVKLLLRAGADPNTCSRGKTPLEVAASNGETEIMRCLLNAGADPKVTNNFGFTPVEVAALAGHSEGVRILLPITCPIPKVSDWSFDGIMKYVNSAKFERKRMLRKVKHLVLSLSKGHDAFITKDYVNAIRWYTEPHLSYVIKRLWQKQPLTNRSLCWAHLNEGDLALTDAIASRMAQPFWPMARYAEGLARNLLKDFKRAAESFFTGMQLDRENRQLNDLFSIPAGLLTIAIFTGPAGLLVY